MNSKKLVSLLSAGALVVSSFSGLMMNSGVAKAVGVATLEGDHLVGGDLGDIINDSTNKQLQMIVGETFSFSASSTSATAMQYGAGDDASTLAAPTDIGITFDTADTGVTGFLTTSMHVAAGTGVETRTATIKANTDTAAVDRIYVNNATVATTPAKTDELDYYDVVVMPVATTADAAVTLYKDAAKETVLNEKTITVKAGSKNVIDIYATIIGSNAGGGAKDRFWKNATVGKNLTAAGNFVITETSDNADLSAGKVATLTNGTTTVKAKDRATLNATYTLTIDATNLKKGDILTVDLGKGTMKSVTNGVLKIEVTADGEKEEEDETAGTVPYAVFEAVSGTTHYENGANTLTVCVPREQLKGESDAEYATYIANNVKKSVTINALWSTDQDARDKAMKDDTIISVKADNKVWENGVALTDTSKNVWLTGDIRLNGESYTAAGIEAPATAASYGLSVSAKNSTVTKTYEGLLVITATGDVTGADGNTTTYFSKMTLKVKVIPANGVKATLKSATSNATLTASYTGGAQGRTWKLEADDFADWGTDATLTFANGDTGAAKVKWADVTTAGSVTESTLKYGWSWKKIARDDAGAAIWVDDTAANKVFELNGDGEVATILPTTALLGGNNYLVATISDNDGALLREAIIEVVLTAEAGEAMTVAVDTSKLEKGYVEIPADTTELDTVSVSVKRASGLDVTKDVSYKVMNYNTYMLAKNDNKVLDDSRYPAATGISVSKGKVTVKHSVDPGVYVVVATDSKLTNWASDEENLIQIKSANGLAVTGLSLDQNTVTITNLNSTKQIVATVEPVVYQSNGYTKNASKSADIDVVSFTVADPSIVDVEYSGRDTYGLSTRAVDNTSVFTFVGRKVGNTTVTFTTLEGGFTQKIAVTVLGDDTPQPEPTPEPEPEHKAGDAFTVDGVSVFVNADGKTLTVTDVTVVGKTATIPATVDGMDVTTIAAQAFKKSDAKTIYVKAAVTDIEKGAFKKAKTKKIFFYEPAALNTVAKNAFKGANVKVVGVGGSFSESAASQLKKAGASKVKNNGTAK